MCRRAAVWVTQVCGWVAATRSLRVLASLHLPPLSLRTSVAPTTTLPLPLGSSRLLPPRPENSNPRAVAFQLSAAAGRGQSRTVEIRRSPGMVEVPAPARAAKIVS